MGKKHVHGGRSSAAMFKGVDLLAPAALQPGQTFLDAGCGNGYVSVQAAARIGPQGKVFALDLFEKSIRTLERLIAKQGLANISAQVTDLTAPWPVGDAAVDVCLFLNVLHGFAANQETGPVLAETARAVKSGGRLLVGEFNKEKSLSGPAFDERLSAEEVCGLTEPYGFEGLEVLALGKHHYMMVMGRT